MILRQLQKLFPDATAETWHQHANGGGWVQNTAIVDASAYIESNAQVYGNARVSGDAQVCDGKWNRSPLYVKGTRYAFNESGPDGCDLVSGCINKPRAWWAANIRRCAEEHGYTPEQVDEYEAIVAFFETVRAIRERHANGAAR